MRWELEEIARETLETTNASLPVDPDLVAIDLELEVYDGGPGCEGYLIGRDILVDDSARPERRAFALAHEIGHYLQRTRGLPDTEHGANYLASALLLPRLEFEGHLRRFGWDLIRLRALHRYASFETVARRIVAIRDARAFVFDKPLNGQREPFWYSVPYGVQPDDLEREAAQAALVHGAPVEITPAITGWPVLEHDWHRVVILTSL